MSEEGKIAFFTPEIAVDNSLYTYSGGLGVFAGGFLIAACKMGLPVVGVTLLPRQGYYDQYLNENQKMGVRYVNRTYEGILEPTGVKFKIPLSGSEVWIEVLKLPAGRFGTTDIYFLDCDIEENDALSRSNTLQLYGGSRDSGANIERKIAQSFILGRGGVRALELLNIPVELYHINESHAAFAALELLERELQLTADLETATEVVRSQVVFTTHTPVRAGNPEYGTYSDGTPMVLKMGSFGKEITSEVLRRVGGEPFNMTASCLRLSRKANAVSQKHGDVAQKLWHWVEDASTIIAITNGTSRDFWQAESFRNANTAEDMRFAKKQGKRAMLRFIEEHTGKHLSENIFTVVWARRFAEYKRPKLLFSDMEWLKSRLSANALQVVIAGRPHPDDYAMIDVWNWLYKRSTELPNLVVLAGYDLDMSKILKAGADLWLNTPRSPDEACGTSGMSAAMNGAINMSTPDGWMPEANPENCFLFGARFAASDQDAYDAEKLRDALDQVLVMYFTPGEWSKRQLAAKLEAEMRWTSDRMVSQYQELLYKK